MKKLEIILAAAVVLLFGGFGAASMVHAASFTYSCYLKDGDNYGYLGSATPVCTDFGGTQGHCPAGYNEIADLGQWGSCHSHSGPDRDYPLPPGGTCGDPFRVGEAYLCSTPPPAGVINVSSANTVTKSAVAGSWSLLGSDPAIPGMDVCSYTHAQCSGTSETYAGLPALNDNYTLIAGSASGQYSLHAIEGPAYAINERSDILAGLLALSNDVLFGIARADSICINNASSCGADSGSLTLTSSNPTGNFTILWDPIATIDVASSLSLSSFAPSGQVQVTNGGSPGSTLNWTASVGGYTKEVDGWLSLSKMSGTAGSESPDTVIMNANTAILAKGAYQATVTFVGTSAPGTPPLAERSNYTKTVTVTLEVGGGCSPSNPDCGGYQPSCPVFTADPAHVVVPLKTTLSYNCTHVSICNIAGSDGSEYAVPVTALSTANGTQMVGPKGSTKYTLGCFGAGHATYATTSVSVDVTATTPGIQEIPPP